MGNSVSRNTSPDLAFAKNTDQPKWENLELNVGSDHYIISTEVSCRGCKRKKWKVRHTRWDAFWDVRTKREHTPIQDLDEWAHTLIKDAESNTTELVQEEDGPKLDSRLIHLWEARSSLQKRWLNQKHNRTLRKRIAQLERDIEKYSQRLSQEHWHQLCDRLDGQLGSKNTWSHICLTRNTPRRPHRKTYTASLIHSQGMMRT